MGSNTITMAMTSIKEKQDQITKLKQEVAKDQRNLLEYCIQNGHIEYLKLNIERLEMEYKHSTVTLPIAK